MQIYHRGTVSGQSRRLLKRMEGVALFDAADAENYQHLSRPVSSRPVGASISATLVTVAPSAGSTITLCSPGVPRILRMPQSLARRSSPTPGIGDL